MQPLWYTLVNCLFSWAAIVSQCYYTWEAGWDISAAEAALGDGTDSGAGTGLDVGASEDGDGVATVGKLRATLRVEARDAAGARGGAAWGGGEDPPARAPDSRGAGRQGGREDGVVTSDEPRPRSAERSMVAPSARVRAEVGDASDGDAMAPGDTAALTPAGARAPADQVAALAPASKSSPDASSTSSAPTHRHRCAAGQGGFREVPFDGPAGGFTTCSGGPDEFFGNESRMTLGQCMARCRESSHCQYVQYQKGAADRPDGPMCHLYVTCRPFRGCYHPYKCGRTYWRDCSPNGRRLNGEGHRPSADRCSSLALGPWSPRWMGGQIPVEAIQRVWFHVVFWVAMLFAVLGSILSVSMNYLHFYGYFRPLDIPVGLHSWKCWLGILNANWNFAATFLTMLVKMRWCISGAEVDGFAEASCLGAMLAGFAKLVEAQVAKLLVGRVVDLTPLASRERGYCKLPFRHLVRL